MEKKFKWDEREAIRAAGIQKDVEKKVNSTIVDNKVKYLSFYHKLLDDLKNDFNIQIKNVFDLKRVIDGCLDLQGEEIQSEEDQVVILRDIREALSCDGQEYIHELVFKEGDERTKRRLSQTENNR